MTILGAGPGAQAAPADLIKDGTDQSFQGDVLQASMETPVIVDFWAPWCGPCRQLGPVLEAAVTKATGAVKLVKINIDENPAVANQLRVQSIPAVWAFDKGRPVDGFMGAVAPSEVTKFVERLSGGGDGAEEIEALLARARDALEVGDPGGAAQDFAQVLQTDPEHPGAIAGLARCYLSNGDPDRARELLATVPEDKREDPEVKSVASALEFAANAADSSETAGLVAHLQSAPDDHEKRFELAQALAAKGDLDAAAEHLLIIIQKDREWNEEAARQELLKIFDAAGPTSALARDGRRKLSSILFS